MNPDSQQWDVGKGEGTAEFQKKSPGVQVFKLSGRTSQGTHFNMELEGSYGSEGNWSGRGQTLQMTFDPLGQLRGSGGRQGVQVATLQGRITPQHLEIRLELLQLRQDHDLAPGVKLIFVYDLFAIERTAKGRPEDLNCNRITWEVRNVADMSGGPMQMIQIPVCRDK